MADGEDFLFRPVLAQMCKLESLKDGTLDLWDVVLANEALDVRAENEWRVHDHYKPHE
jgi:Family of unknown function (DUF6889)